MRSTSPRSTASCECRTSTSRIASAVATKAGFRRTVDRLPVLRQREYVKRLPALWNLDVRHDRGRHVARAAAAETRHDGDILPPIDREADRESLSRRTEPRFPENLTCF